eukprot:CFRG2467T1
MNSTFKPKKRIVGPGGRMIVNPEWRTWKETQDAHEVVQAKFKGEEYIPAGKIYAKGTDMNAALVPVTGMDDHEEMLCGGFKNMMVGEVKEMIEEMNDAEYAEEVGIYTESTDTGVAGVSMGTVSNLLQKAFAKYELSSATVSKIMRISTYDAVEFIIDDSGSMGATSDTPDAITGQIHTRWSEAKYRIKQKLEILSLFACPSIRFRFMNHTMSDFMVVRAGKSPEQFKKEIFSLVDGAFRVSPSGGTPAYSTLKQSFDEGIGKKIFRYVYFDGVPNERVANAEQMIRDLLLNRTTRGNPEDNPINFLSCTEDDDAVEWVKQLEEASMYDGGPSYLAEIDDFDTEASEVFGDQGRVFPYNKGMYLVCSIVAAAFPDTLDALDESIPFPKYTLERDFVGFDLRDEDYKRYWDGFLEAQRAKRSTNAYKSDPVERFKADFGWHFNDFYTYKGESADIPSVRMYHQGLTNLVKTIGKTQGKSAKSSSFASWFW